MNELADVLRNSEVIAFDWDGVLVDSIPGKIAQNQALAHEFGNELTTDEVRTIWNNSAGFPDLMQKLCLTDDMEAIMTVVRRDYDKPEFAKKRFPWSTAVLHRVQDLNKRSALVTNLTRELFTADAESVGIQPIGIFFDYTQTADESEYRKPNPLVFANLLSRLNVEPPDVVYLGDELKDFTAARDAGMNFIGIETGMATKEEFHEAGAISVSSLQDLPFPER